MEWHENEAQVEIIRQISEAQAGVEEIVVTTEEEETDEGKISLVLYSSLYKLYKRLSACLVSAFGLIMFSIISSGQDRVPDQIDEVTGKTMTVVETEVDLEEAKKVEHLLATNAKEELAQAQVVLVDPREAVQVVQALVAALVPVLTHRDRRIKKVSFRGPQVFNGKFIDGGF